MKLHFSKVSLEELKDKLKSKFPQLTESDLSVSETSDSCMMRMIEYKLRMTKKELRDVIAEL